MIYDVILESEQRRHLAPIEPWFIATEPFTPENGTKWRDYVAWSGIEQLEELVSLDSMLCPTLLPRIKDEYWPYIVNEDFMLHAADTESRTRR